MQGKITSLGRRFGAGKMHLSPPPLPVTWAAVRSKVVDLLLNELPNCLWEFCVCLCFVMHYVVSILVL